MSAAPQLAPFNLRAAHLAVNPREWPTIDQEAAQFLRPRNGIYTVEQDQMLQRLARGRWFLLQNRGPKGYAYRCARCKRIHDYFTLHCIERPMNGLTHVIGVMSERMDRDTLWSAIELGAIVPIDQRRAKALFEKLRALRYTAQELLGSQIGLAARYSPAQMRELLG